MTTSLEIVADMCEANSNCVNSADLDKYAKLFTEDSIRMPPGSNPEHGPQQYIANDRDGYEKTKWQVALKVNDVLDISEDWVFGIVNAEGTMQSISGEESADFKFTATRLLQRRASGEWLI
jgi:ketosteroid isomerase-like protein